jgi:hypothetical protein
MKTDFDITLTEKDMYRFNLYQMYTGFNGIFSVVAGIGMFVWAIVSVGRVQGTYTAMYILFGILFLIYMPVSLLLRVKHTFAASDVLKGTLHYSVDKSGIAVSQGDANAKLTWDQVYKFVATKNHVLIYSTRTNAYVVPCDQLGEHFDMLVEIAQEKLPKYRLKIKG